MLVKMDSNDIIMWGGIIIANALTLLVLITVLYHIYMILRDWGNRANIWKLKTKIESTLLFSVGVVFIIMALYALPPNDIIVLFIMIIPLCVLGIAIVLAACFGPYINEMIKENEKKTDTSS